MSLPGNGIFVVKGEISIIMTAMKRGARWSSHSYQDDTDTLLKNFHELSDVLNKIDDLRLMEPDAFLSPFLEVIRSEETTGPITSLALSAINKFLSYGLIDPTHTSIPQTVYNIADAVTHARFVGTDQSSDGVVLLRILQVLRTLTLAPEGATLTNESLCEIMLSCFRICFETRLNELLRKTAEHYLKDMVQLVFMRLPQFSEDLRAVGIKQLKMRANTLEPSRSKRRSRHSFSKKKDKIVNKNIETEESLTTPANLAKPQNALRANPLSTTPMTPGVNIVDMQGSISQNTPQNVEGVDVNSPSSFPNSEHNESNDSQQCSVEISVQSPLSDKDDGEETMKCEESELASDTVTQAFPEGQPLIQSSNRLEETIEQPPSDLNLDSDPSSLENIPSSPTIEAVPDGLGEAGQEYVNQRGIRFTPLLQEEVEVVLVPYGLACVRELFRFLISLCNPQEKQNTDVMIHLGLTLLTVAFEVGADSIGKYNTLLALVKDDLCRHLFSLLNSERLSVFAADLQVSFLMFESLRTHLKFQLECYLIKLIDIVISENVKVTYEHKEIALDNILQLWRIPGFVTELYLNYDCDMYCTNLFEDLTKLLAKNAFSATSGVYHTHLLSLDALLTVIESIEMHCSDRKADGTENGSASLSGNSDAVASISSIIGKTTRVKLSEDVPSKEELCVRRNIKKWLPTGTEHFNLKPKKGIQFFQEHGVIKSDKDAHEIAMFLRKNPALDKKVIGEYISNRNNLHILDAFVKTFNFTGVRIDDALRSFLETFRLPGESPTISLILEQFAEHWHKSNGEPFADVDSAFTLAYAVIMLNVDQHNQNAKKQTAPMSANAFKKNLKGVNGGNDFDEEMLDEIYNCIKNDEIVMPAEQTGLVKENYLWKMLLRKGASNEGLYYHVNCGAYDAEQFQLIYAPTVAALSFVFEKSEEPSIYKRVMQGFERCAFISAHFSMTNNLDTIILSLCKFTIFYGHKRQNNLTAQFGANQKAQLALKSVFSLIHLHGDNVREGWRNVFDLILSLYCNGLLPKSYVEAEDFIDPSGKVALAYQEVESLQKQDTGLLSSLYSYMVSAENLSKLPTPEEQQSIDLAKECIKDCNLEQLITDSKFLHEEALLEMVKTLNELSRGPDVQKSLGYNYNESVTVFFMELLFKIVIQNRDRVITIWQYVRDHIYTLMMNSSVFDYQFLLERSVIGLLRIAIRLMRNEEMCPIVIQSLRMLLLLKSSTLCRISRQISYGLYELLKTSAQNIHTTTDWTIIFTLLECVGAGAQPPKPIADDSGHLDQGTKSDGENQVNSDEESLSTDRGYTSDSELTRSPKHNLQRSHSPVIIQTSPVGTPNTGGWILVGNEGEIQPVVGRTLPPTQYGISLDRNLGQRDPASLIKCCESLAFLVRDVAHITPYNFDICVHCIRTFVEASLQENKRNRKLSSRESRSRRKLVTRKRAELIKSKKNRASSPEDENDDDSDEDEFPSGYHHLLLDLMHTLHTRTAQIFRWWAEEGGEIAQETSLWTQGWCPLLQGIARMCCDKREEVRMSAIAFLQRALLVHDLQTLTGPEWEQCFHRVLFPLLSYLLQPVSPKEPIAMAEFRNRAATVLSKVFLHHLSPLLSLSTFHNLWMVILDFMDKYMHADKSDILFEAIPELLKNMLLVMNSAKVFDGPDGTKNALWHLTWERIGKFLPNLKDELFKEIDSEKEKQEIQQPRDILQPKPINPMQHNIDAVTRSSIILQPPASTQKSVSSRLFAHLGQIVPTPIGPTTYTTPPDISKPLDILTQPQPTNIPIPIIPNSTSPIMQPTLPTGMPYMSNLFSNTPPNVCHLNQQQQQQQQHTFPVLYNSPSVIPSTTTTEIQPVSLYAEYMGNPYNVPSPDVYTLDPTAQKTQQSTVSTSSTNNTSASSTTVSPAVTADITSNNLSSGDLNQNKNIAASSSLVMAAGSGSESLNNNPTNFFKSSNYFSTASSTGGCIPVGSEILFGVEGFQQTINIPVSAEGKSTNV